MGRMEKINQMIKKEIGLILQREMRDPRLSFVTITKADVSPDLHNARINFSFLGDPKDMPTVQDTLNGASNYIRKLIGKRISLRFTPHFEFLYDPSIEYGARIEQTLKEINESVPSDSKEDKEG